MAVPRARVLDLMKVQCRIFNTTFNPENLRTGNKILRQRLKGPALASYYPPKLLTHKTLMQAFGRNFTAHNEDETDRLEKNVVTRSRGKGPPKKKRSADGDSKSKKKKK